MEDIDRGPIESYGDHPIGISGVVCRVVPGAIEHTADVDELGIDVTRAALRTLCPCPIWTVGWLFTSQGVPLFVVHRLVYGF